MFDNGHSPTVPVSAPGQDSPLWQTRPRHENGGFPRLRSLGTARAEQRAQGQTPSGRVEMDKFESFAFAIGFIACGLLTIAAQVSIV
jgi:hypothetical protein